MGSAHSTAALGKPGLREHSELDLPNTQERGHHSATDVRHQYFHLQKEFKIKGWTYPSLPTCVIYSSDGQ